MYTKQFNPRPLLFLFIIAGLLLFITQAQAAPVPESTAVLPTTPSPLYGVNFISSAEEPADEQQYQNGLSTGAAWNRWPLYWFNIEQSDNYFDWTAVDTAIQGDVSHGLRTNAILLGTPPFYTTPLRHDHASLPRAAHRSALSMEAIHAATPVGLYDPIFSDGSDIPGPGKTINSNNRWARFVATAVERYKPGGQLAQLNGWPQGAGITHWEIWNEQDYLFFWDGTLPDYARLLKVAYLTIEQFDPDAQVILGGLSNINDTSVGNPNFYSQMMSLYDADPTAVSYHYFHDIVATHSYFYAWNSWYHVWRAGNTLAERGLDKPIWLNENGVTAWDDYPGPVWDPQSGLRATVQEQADFVIQSALYSTYAGADALFHFQLYDGCGNQPSGTDFPPHHGELCDANGLVPGTNFPCAGDAHGLFSNPTDAACFTQHPTPESPRPHYEAYKVLTNHFTAVEPLWWQQPANGTQEWIAFYQSESQSRLIGLWARTGNEQTAVVPSTNLAGQGQLISPDGTVEPITAVDGFFTIPLPAATNQNAPWAPDLYPIGGRPYLLVEADTVPPSAFINGPALADDLVPLNWGGSDDGSGIQDYSLWVSVDGGPAVAWLTNVSQTSGTYASEPWHSYTFTVRSRDRAGNQSSETAVTVQTIEFPYKVYLPIINRP